jgi:hypothetical protein
MDSLEFLSSLAKEGGEIVSSGECSAAEIVFARAERRFFADADGMGYVRRPARKPLMVSEGAGIVHLDDFRPHYSASVECGCGYRWQAVYPEDATKLECAKCGAFVPAPHLTEPPQ